MALYSLNLPWENIIQEFFDTFKDLCYEKRCVFRALQWNGHQFGQSHTTESWKYALLLDALLSSRLSNIEHMEGIFDQHFALKRCIERSLYASVPKGMRPDDLVWVRLCSVSPWWTSFESSLQELTLLCSEDLVCWEHSAFACKILLEQLRSFGPDLASVLNSCLRMSLNSNPGVRLEETECMLKQKIELCLERLAADPFCSPLMRKRAETQLNKFQQKGRFQKGDCSSPIGIGFVAPDQTAYPQVQVSIFTDYDVGSEAGSTDYDDSDSDSSIDEMDVDSDEEREEEDPRP